MTTKCKILEILKSKADIKLLKEGDEPYIANVDFIADSIIKLFFTPDVVGPKETFICKICDEEMEIGEQCGPEKMSCLNYTGK